MAEAVYDICIVGGGASGMAAAITALGGRPSLSVVLLEKNDSTGKKIRATGNGRCNITNSKADGYLQSLAFFRSIGLVTREYSDGTVYPYSENAGDVADILYEELVESGCCVMTGAAVTDVERVSSKSEASEIGRAERGGTGESDGAFAVRYEFRNSGAVEGTASLRARRVILATGGKAGPAFGTAGDGYGIAGRLGHSLTKPIPVLTRVLCEADGCDRLAGIRVKCRLSLYRDETEAFEENSAVFQENGELQFTKNGISGIAVFNMTRMMRLEEGGFGDFAADVNLYADGDVYPLLCAKRDTAYEKMSSAKAAAALKTVLRDELAEYVTMRAGISPDKKLSELTDGELGEIAETVHALRFRPTGLSGWRDAQCTSGGVILTEIDSKTCESLIVPDLYITGELLDYDGPCGGYNLTNAWVTGIAAGKSAAGIER